MDKIINYIEKLLTVTDEEVKKRKDFFCDQSINWQIHEEGIQYAEATDRLCVFQKMLNEWCEEITLSSEL